MNQTQSSDCFFLNARPAIFIAACAASPGRRLKKWICRRPLEEHHGYRVEQTTAIFPAKSFRLLRRKGFQLGLNNLFVFERVGGSG